MAAKDTRDFNNAECDRCRGELQEVMTKLKQVRENEDDVVRELASDKALLNEDTFHFVRADEFKAAVKKHLAKHLKKTPEEILLTNQYENKLLWNFAVLVVREELELKRLALAEAVATEMIQQLAAEKCAKLDLSSRGFKHANLAKCDIPRMGEALKELVVSYNLVEQLPEDLFKAFGALEVFECIGNVIEDVPVGISAAKSLTKLDLRWNHLLHINPAIFELANLEELWLSYNSIKEIGGGIGKLAKLHTLVLDANPAHKLPAEVGQLSSLKILAINKMGDFDEASHNAGVQAGHKFSELPVELGQCSQLEKLYCMYNQLASLPKEVCLPSLKELHVTGSPIQNFPDALQDCVNLEFLDISKNDKLAYFPSDLMNIKGLTSEEVFLFEGTDIPDDVQWVGGVENED